MPRLIFTVLLLLALPTTLAAQATLSGRLVEVSSGRPMFCLHVTLLDSAGVARDSTYSGFGGLFEFAVPEHADFRLRISSPPVVDVQTAPERTGAATFFSREYRITLTPDPRIFTDTLPGDSITPIGLAPGSPGPRYPRALQREGVEGAVHYTFAIDTLGQIDTASAFPLRATHRLFLRAVQEALPRIRFRPWSPTGMATCTRVVQPFLFRLQR
ncbi:TonB family protein [Pseudogemmatithrix spongiicola]|uniref:TonB family protein n=1 Tax=Pseudogemmatithrix spongiicola TaxID=3062599 RepID=A0AA49Q576_9BACT|nr:TonB family protein [Gemmatimonadaceae bacterium 'strain 138']WKW15730.1 TonB family protein [Gemmatimonadaceae bacterium 'strain 318']